MFLGYFTLYYYLNLFNTNLCNSCLNVTQSIKDSPNLDSNFHRMEQLCAGNQNCIDTFNNTYNYIVNHTSSEICYDFGLCSEVSMANYVSTSPSNNVNIFQKDNQLLGYKLSNLSNSDFELYWNLTFPNDILTSEFSYYNYPNTPSFCKQVNYTILTIDTIYNKFYFNYTDDIPYFIGNTSQLNKVSEIDIKTNLNYNLKKNESYLNAFYNSTHFNQLFSVWDNFTSWNCYTDGYLQKCCDASINNIVLNSTKLSFS